MVALWCSSGHLFLIKKLRICFWLHWVSCCAWAFSGLQRMGVLSVAAHGLPTRSLLLLWCVGSGLMGFVVWLAGFRAQAQKSWCMGPVAPWHIGSSWARDQTHVPCIARWFLSTLSPGKPQALSFFIDLLFRCSSPLLKVGNWTLLLLYWCLFLFQLCWHLYVLFRCCDLGCICNSYIFLVDQSFYQYIISFVTCDSFGYHF